jgi:hypothetical protein
VPKTIDPARACESSEGVGQHVTKNKSRQAKARRGIFLWNTASVCCLHPSLSVYVVTVQRLTIGPLDCLFGLNKDSSELANTKGCFAHECLWLLLAGCGIVHQPVSGTWSNLIRNMVQCFSCLVLLYASGSACSFYFLSCSFTGQCVHVWVNPVG